MTVASPHSSRTLTETESNLLLGYAVFMGKCGLWEFGSGKQLNAVVALNRTVEDSGAESNVDYDIPAQGVSEENNIN